MRQRHIIFTVSMIIATIALISFVRAGGSKIIPIISPNEQIPELSSDKELVAFLEEFVQEIADDNNYNGVMLFARDDRIFFHRAYGIANHTSGEPITPETKFNLASASKMFTAVGIAKLVEEGRLNFNDPIRKYLDSGWISEEVGQKVFISHLMSHTSGMGSYWDEWDKHRDSIYVIDDFKKIISDELSFEPGTDGQYSNSGYILLGAIIEFITGQSYYEYVNELIFEPLRMKNTGFFRNDEPFCDRAVGYFEDKDDNDILKDNLDMHGTRGNSAGGSWSTASDMHRFMQAFASDALISSSSREYLTTPNRLFKNYGYGFQLGTTGWYGHWGGFPGIEAFIMYYSETGHTLVIFSNYYDSALPLLKKLKHIYKKMRGE